MCFIALNHSLKLIFTLYYIASIKGIYTVL